MYVCGAHEGTGECRLNICGVWLGGSTRVVPAEFCVVPCGLSVSGI